MLGTYGQLMFITGECYLLNTVDPETEEERWEIVSTDELKRDGSTYRRRVAPGFEPVMLKAADDEEYRAAR